MALHIWPIRALFDAVGEELAAAATIDEVDAAPQFIGEKHLADNGSPPRYVWVPTTLRESRDVATQATEELRTVAGGREYVSAYCWADSYDQASAMRSNLVVACKRQAAVDMQLEGGEWVRPSTGWNQKGECFRLDFSLEIPFVDGFVPLPTLVQPEVSITDLEAIEAEIFKSPDVEHDGDSFVTVRIEEP